MKKTTLLLLTFLMSCFSYGQVTDVYYIDYGGASIGTFSVDPVGTVTEFLDTGTTTQSGSSIAYDAVNQKIYYSDFETADGKIWRVNLDGTGLEAIVTGITDPYGIALDLVAGKVYWADDAGNIGRSNLDGSIPEPAFIFTASSDSSGLGWMRSVTVDPVNGKIYYYEVWDEDLWVADLDGTNAAVLIAGVYGYSLLVDAANGKIYFDDQNTPGLKRADLNGTNIELVDATNTRVYGIDIDYVNNKLYWSGRDSQEINRADLDGSNKEVLISALPDPRGVITYAQSKTWDFGNDTTNWPLDGTGVADNIVNDNFGIFMGTTSSNNVGIIEASSGSATNWALGGDVDGYRSVNRFKYNGDAGIVDLGGGMLQPTKRYAYFNVTGPCTVKVWFRASSGRTLYLTDDSYLPFASATTPNANGGEYIVFGGNYSGGAGNIYMFGDAATYLYKIEVTPDTAIGTTTTLGINDFNSVSTSIQAIGNRIYVSNVKTKTEVNIYSITGALVKSLKTNEDIDFSLRTGLFIAIVKTDEGQKAVKLLTH